MPRPRFARSPRWLSSVTLACCLLLAACGNVTPGGFSRVDVDVSGDAQEPATEPAPARSVHEGSMGAPAAAPSLDVGDDVPRGEVRARFALSIVSEDGVVSEIDDDVRVRVDLEGREDADAAEALVLAGTYTELRIVFMETRAEIESGLPVLGEIRVELQDAALEVSRPIELTLEEGETAQLLIDLNAPAWVAAVDPLTRTVDPAVFAARIEVVAR